MPRGGKREGSGRRRKDGTSPIPHAKIDAALGKLNKRQQDYARGVIEGKTKRQAAKDAGYSKESGDNAAAVIEGPKIRALFAEVVRARIKGEKLALRIDEGLDATVVKVFQTKEGKIIESREYADQQARAAFVKLAAEYGQYHIPKAEVSGLDGAPIETKVTFEIIGKKKDG
jgi:hypothetical protein